MSEPPKSAPERGLGDRTARGAVLMVAMRWAQRGIGMLSVAIVARILTPEDFGLMAMATSVMLLTTTFSWIGLQVALIRHPAPTRAHYDTAWTLNLALNAVIAAVVAALAPLAAEFYGEPRIFGMLLAMTGVPLLQGLSNIRIVDFRRDLDFGTELKYTLYSRLAAFAATLACLVFVQDYRALVFGLLAHSVCKLLFGYGMRPYLPRFSLACGRELMSFSVWMVLISVARTLGDILDRLTLGRIASAHVTGAYTTSQDTARIFTLEMTGAIGAALLPATAKVQSDQAAIRRAQRLSTGMFAIAAAPFAFGLCATATDFVRIVLGPQWGFAVPLLQVVALDSGLRALSAHVDPMTVAVGRARAIGLLETGHAVASLVVLTAVALLAVAPDGMEIAWSRLGISLGYLPAAFLVLTGFLWREAFELMTLALRPVLAGLAMFAVVALLHIDGLDLPPLTFAIDVAVGAVCYPAFLFLIWRLAGAPDGAEAYAFERLWALLRRRA